MKSVHTNGENKDFIALCRLLDEYLNDIVGGEKQREQYNQYNKLDDIHDVVLLYEDELPVGCAAFKFYEAYIAEVKRVFIRKEFRGKGLSLLLMEELEKRAKEQGYKSFILETGKLLDGAMGLYQKIGFHIIENYGQYINMSESVCMRKEL